MKFSQQYPGALGAYFLFQVRQKSGMTSDLKMQDLAATDISSWAINPAMTGLSEVRDQKEVLFLSQVLCDLGNHRLGRVSDLVAQRIREIRAAKQSQSSWEKAAVVSLMAQPIANVAPMLDNAFVL